VSSTRPIFAGLILCALASALPQSLRAAPGDGVIRLRAPAASPEPAPISETAPAAAPLVDVSGPRRGFDYHAFEARLESLWFQRKTLLADGRRQDAVQQSQLMRAFCAEESVRRVEGLASTLLGEAARRLEQGDHAGALESLELAQSFDPGRPEVHLALARVYLKSGRGPLAAARQLASGLRSSIVRGTRDLSLFNQLGLILVVAAVGAIGLFALLMIVRYNVPFRHEIEESVAHTLGPRWAGAAGWAVLLLPFVLPFAAGWAALYWILVTFRFMHRGEKLAALALLVVAALAVPAYRMGVSAYGMTADPVVRTTLASAGGEYDPDRILKLRQLVHAHPDDAVYRFLLAGLYKNGRYLEDAFAEYKEALALDESFEQAHINLGNIFFATGQYSEAITSYNRAIEIDPDSVLAYFNRHLAQSEAFRFQEAEQTLEQARAIDAPALAALFASAGSSEDRASPVDATIEIRSLWEAALAGGATQTFYRSSVHSSALDPLLNPVSLLSLATLFGCLAAVAISARRTPARRCIRCGKPFCRRCKSDRDTHEYCSQCLHLFVLGDGLSPDTKTRKLYEVDRYERTARRARRFASLVLPGAAQLLRGRAVRGVLLIVGWLAALVAWKPDLLAGLERALHVELALEELRRGGVTAGFGIHPLAVFGLTAVLAIWVTANAWLWRRREA
jgi:tetratricopeptide (TPR) repeat protein